MFLIKIAVVRLSYLYFENPYTWKFVFELKWQPTGMSALAHKLHQWELALQNLQNIPHTLTLCAMCVAPIAGFILNIS